MSANAIKKNERIHTLDIIRGIAVLGIIIANMYVFKTLFADETKLMFTGAVLPDGMFNQIVSIFVSFFIDNKFYPMFSLLFGLGFFIFYDRLRQKGLSAGRLFSRRLVFLLVIGLIHLVFLWTGDILHTYALAGFLLLLFINRKPRTILLWAVLMLGIGTFILTAMLTVSGLMLSMMGTDEFVQNDTRGMAITTMMEGTYMEILQYRFVNEVVPVLFNVFLTVPGILPLFLIGLYMGKTRMFHDVAANLNRWKKICIHSCWSGLASVAIVVGLKYGLGPLPASISYGISEGLHFLAGPILMLFYVSALVLLLHSGGRLKLFMPIAAVGRMALTNYLLQTLIGVSIFYGFGLGLFGQVSIGGGFLLAIAIYIIQLILSHFYLKKFKQGPLEYLWRKWTYGGKLLT
ncbi:DUF418 domain-containing protein [Salicibibacter cibi]|uniref:DUF418 domain-containing protein n=1 Tax=Salicibibacter cibi TaxID=2743001 RepID=A0A7T6Z9Q2_9BACI|nr:DUF418 domain-containing protein [Salicibibacter cibi]QQK79513.1 DUF418 domain-containing protein [Salicibibacter cibi]